VQDAIMQMDPTVAADFFAEFQSLGGRLSGSGEVLCPR
jgi:hypothetical protein